MSASIIVPYRADADGWRLANLEAVLARLPRALQLEVLVVEQDAAPTLGVLPHPAARTLFAFNPGPFNKAWAANMGARAAASPVLVFCDADVIVGASLERAIAHCVERYDFAKPYVRLVDLDAAQSQALREGAAALPGAGVLQAGRGAAGEHLVLCGGAFVIRRDAFFAIGGFDERFVGWGGEDDALSEMVERARLSTVELDDEAALHMWHPRPAVGAHAHAHYAANARRAAGYRGAGDAELARFAELNAQLCGNPRKYVPRPSTVIPAQADPHTVIPAQAGTHAVIPAQAGTHAGPWRP